MTTEAAAVTATPIVPDHTLERVIGRGAYGDVWMARSVLGTARAVKIVWRERFDHARPFEREFRGVQQVEPLSRQHPALVDILQVGLPDDRRYFYCVMELADDLAGEKNAESSAPQYTARTLRSELARRGRLPVQEVAEIGMRLADGLHFLHSRGLAHRDLKPSNIVFVGGEPKLGDVGLVAPINGDRSFVGTDGYIAPEGPGTPAADVFALGLVLYEAATGLSRHDFPQIPASLATDTDGDDFAELNTVLLRACAADPANRYASADRLSDDLRLLTDGRSVRRLRELEGRLNRIRNAGFVLAIAGLLATAGWAFQRQQAQAAREEAAREHRQVAALAAKESELQLNLYAADMAQAGEAIRAGNLGRARDLLRSWQPDQSRSDIRDQVWHFLSAAAAGDPHRVLRGHARNVSGLTFSPQANALISCGFDGTLRSWDVETGAGKILADLKNEPLYQVATLTSGDLLVGGTSSVWRVEAAGTSVAAIAAGPARHLATAAGMPWVAFGGKSQIFGKDDPVEVVSVASGETLRRLPQPSGRCSVSFDGALLATGEVDGICLVYRTSDWTVATTLKCPGQLVSITFSPNGRLLAGTLREGGVLWWDISNPEPIFRSEAHNHQVVWCSAFSADGKWLATGGSDQSVHLWNVEARRLERIIRGHEDEVWSAVFAPDGSWLATSGKDETIRIWPLQSDITTAAGNQVSGPAIFSSDGAWIACKTPMATGVFASRDFRKVADLPEAGFPVAFSRDGTLVCLLTNTHEMVWCTWREGTQRQRISLVAASDSRPGQAHLSADQKLLAVVRRDGSLAVFSATEGTMLFEQDEEGAEVQGVAFSTDGSRLACSRSNFTVSVHETARWQRLAQFVAHKMRTSGLAFSPDGSLLATSSWDGTAAIWSLPEGKRLHSIRGHTTSMQDVAFFPGGGLLGWLEGDGSVGFWDLRSQRASARLSPAIEESNHHLSVSPDGTTILATGQSSSRPGTWSRENHR